MRRARVRAWSTGERAATTRYALVTAVVVLALVRGVVPPPAPPAWTWVAAAGVVGLGAERTQARRRAALGCSYAAVGPAIVAVLACAGDRVV